jgi:hypothetical protein
MTRKHFQLAGFATEGWILANKKPMQDGEHSPAFIETLDQNTQILQSKNVVLVVSVVGGFCVDDLVLKDHSSNTS